VAIIENTERYKFTLYSCQNVWQPQTQVKFLNKTEILVLILFFVNHMSKFNVTLKCQSFFKVLATIRYLIRKFLDSNFFLKDNTISVLFHSVSFKAVPLQLDTASPVSVLLLQSFDNVSGSLQV
jgi:hypothetical protein